MDGLLGERRYLLGDAITEADWRIFPTLARFDEVYVTHFRCNRRRIADYGTSGPTRATSTSSRAWQKPSRWTRSSATTTRPMTS